MTTRTPPGAIGVRLSLMMFLQFFVWGSWYASVGVYMGAHGMSADDIGWAYTVGPIAALVSPLLLGMVADRFFATQRVLAVMHLLGGALMFVVPRFTDQPSMFVNVLALHMLCYMPTLGLTNTLAFHHMVNQERQFPFIRVFGTIGWIAANLVVSSLLEADRHADQFRVAGAAALALGLFSFTLPHTPPPAAGKPFSARDAFGLDALSLLRAPAFAVFVVCSFLICIPLAAYYSFANVYLGALGVERVAAHMSLGQMSEIVFMLLMPFFFARLGVKWMLAVGMLAWVVRYGLFAAAADAQVMWMVLGGILLHGICYDFFFVTGQIWVDKRASPRIRGQAQGLLVLVTQGLGLGVGAQITSRIVDAHTTGQANETVRDWQTIWIYPAAAAAAVLLAFVLLFRDRGEAESA